MTIPLPEGWKTFTDGDDDCLGLTIEGENGPLTAEQLDDFGVLICQAGIVTLILTAHGGTPPYTWSVTGAVNLSITTGDTVTVISVGGERLGADSQLLDGVFHMAAFLDFAYIGYFVINGGGGGFDDYAFEVGVIIEAFKCDETSLGILGIWGYPTSICFSRELLVPYSTAQTQVQFGGCNGTAPYTINCGLDTSTIDCGAPNNNCLVGDTPAVTLEVTIDTTIFPTRIWNGGTTYPQTIPLPFPLGSFGVPVPITDLTHPLGLHSGMIDVRRQCMLDLGCQLCPTEVTIVLTDSLGAQRVLVLNTPPAPPSAFTLYGAQFGLDIVDQNDGHAISTVGSFVNYRITGMDIHPITDVLYGSTSTQSFLAKGHLVIIDITTGVVTDVGSFGAGFGSGASMSDISFDPITNVLYGWKSAGSHGLYTIDVTTGLATLVGGTTAQSGGGALAFNSAGILYSAPDGNGTTNLKTVDKATGVPTIIASLGKNIGAMTFALDGTLFGADPFTSIVVTIDPLTAVVTVLGTNSYDALVTVAI